jgi:hypothetical protein
LTVMPEHSGAYGVTMRSRPAWFGVTDRPGQVGQTTSKRSSTTGVSSSTGWPVAAK